MEKAEAVISRIRQRRWQMLVHSHLYYIGDDPIISDDTWQRWANELAQLQQENPELTNIGLFDKEFSDWTGDTGFHLPLLDSEVSLRATRIKRTHDERQYLQRSQGAV